MNLTEQLERMDLSNVDILFVGDPNHSIPYARSELGKAATYLHTLGFTHYGAEAPIESKPSFDALNEKRYGDIDPNARWGPVWLESRQQYEQQRIDTNRALTYRELVSYIHSAHLSAFPFDIREEEAYKEKSGLEQEVGLADTIERHLEPGNKMVIFVGELHTAKEENTMRTILSSRGYNCRTICLALLPF